MRRVYACLLAVALAAAGTARAQPPDPITLPALDSKLELRAYWFKADSAGPRPAVITLHGCSGALDEQGRLNPGWLREAGYFNAENMHLLVLDSFTPRGVKSICSVPASRRNLHEEDRRGDVFAAIAWLQRQPEVDPSRIALIGRSHGGSTVLSTLDRADAAVRTQALKPKAAIALYPGCLKPSTMRDYDLSAPLLLMIGAADDWTPAKYCVALQEKVKRAHPQASFELHVFPDSHHGFDGIGPVRVRTDVGGTRSGTATVGGNPQYREQAHRRTFDFLSEQFGQPLLLTHDERLHGHNRPLPPASGFAGSGDVGAVPLDERGRARYRRYLSLDRPKAFVITEQNGWYLSAGNRDAMQASLERCGARLKCWLYAVDDRVVWQAAPEARIDLAKLRAK